MEILIAIELIAGVIFVVAFVRNLERELTQRSYQRLLDPLDDEEDDAANTSLRLKKAGRMNNLHVFSGADSSADSGLPDLGDRRRATRQGRGYG
ncbi:MAG: hypothetical protein ACLPV8_10390 [Steroidobacteraceae bacterium]